MKQFVSVLLIVLLWNISSSAQTFSEVSEATGFSVLSMSDTWGNGVSFFDVNEDGWDDLTVCVSGAPTRFYLNSNGNFFLHTIFFNDLDSKACVWIDIDQDGDNDLFVSRYNASHQVFINQGNLTFEDQSFGTYSMLCSLNDYSWGVSFGDYTRDGYLDVCFANYGIVGNKNIIASGLPQGDFKNEEIPVLNNSIKTSFQPIWLDLDEDLYQDLYIINDHFEGNDYYAQLEDGNFVDRSVATGLNIPSSSMSNSWCDYDNDGDFDVYITNTIEGNRLLRNNGDNVFSDIAVESGVQLNKWTWSALWLDADNDSWSDLHVCGKDLVNSSLVDNNYFFKNNEGQFLTITDSGISGHSYGSYSSAKGDIDNDGRVDVLLATEMNVRYKLFHNTTENSNNYFKFRLEGRLSNRNGIGTRYEYWMGGQGFKGYTYCGEGYLSQNSQNIILGLGNSNQIDSLKLFWISGVVDEYTNLGANQFQVFTEGETRPIIEASKTVICPADDSVNLEVDYWPIVVWHNGISSAECSVSLPGTYAATVSTGFGHSLILSKTIGLAEAPTVLLSQNNPSCYSSGDGSVLLQWTSDSIEHFLEYSNLYAGEYNLPLSFGEGCTTYVQVELLNVDSLMVQPIVSDATCFGSDDGNVTVSISGGTPPYNFGDGSNFVINDLIAGDYSGVLLDANGCEVLWNATVNQPSPLVVTANSEMPSVFNDGSIILTVNGGIEPYSFEWNNGNQLPENNNLQEGNYAVQVTDSNGCTADTTISLIFNMVNSLNLNTMNWTLHKDGLHYDGSETLHHVFVYDAVGRLLHREQIMAGHTIIPMDASGPVFILSHEGNWKSSMSLE